MIIATLADLHLNKGVYKKVMDRKDYPTLPFRSADFMRAFKWSIEKCIELNPDLVVIAGDIYDHPEPSNEIRGFFSEQLSELILNGIAVRILIGNHDVCKKNHALNDIEGLCLPNIKVIASPELEFFRNKKGEEMRLLLFPYSLDIERGAATIKVEFHNFIDKVAKSAPVDCPSLFFGHFPVYGGIMNRYNVGEDENLLNPTITDTTSTLTEDFNQKDLSQKEYKNINKEDVGFDD
jgi:DNA repair exonuclease SbcCD nuclease subunit